MPKKTIKEMLLQGIAPEDIIKMGHMRQSVIRAQHELENGILPGDRYRKPKTENIDIAHAFASDTKSTDAQYQQLAIAIVLGNVIELADAYTERHKFANGGKYNSVGNPGRIRDLEHWFYKDASYYTNIPPEVMIKAAHMRAESRLKGKKPKRYRYPWLSRDSYTTEIDYRRKEQNDGTID